MPASAPSRPVIAAFTVTPLGGALGAAADVYGGQAGGRAHIGASESPGLFQGQALWLVGTRQSLKKWVLYAEIRAPPNYFKFPVLSNAVGEVKLLGVRLAFRRGQGPCRSLSAAPRPTARGPAEPTLSRTADSGGGRLRVQSLRSLCTLPRSPASRRLALRLLPSRM